jgi:transcriptional regulator with XRE-family HTH domain
MTTETKPNKKTPEPTDVHVGARIRLQRNLIGMSQEKLAEGLGVTFQQVQKYEKGTNRVGASRLQRISEVLGVPISFFFTDAPSKTIPAIGGEGVEEALHFLSTTEGLALNRAFASVRDDKVRRRIVDLVKSLVAAEI